jgi:class 3 adenylate cyclase
MAFWGAPAPMPDHAARACRAALAIRRAVTLDNEARRRQDLPPIRLRVGIHTGRAIVGNIGAPGRINYTLVGDTVNVAQRLEELAREVADPGRAVSILASGAVAAKLGDEFGVVPEGERALRGREGEIRVFRLE